MADAPEAPAAGRGRGWNFRGKRPEGAGRKKGSLNKVTREFRAIVQDLIDKNAPNVERWLDQVANGVPAEYETDPETGERRLIRREIPANPEKALALLDKLAEYAAPKLSRTELTGPGGAPLAPPSVTVQIEGAPPPPNEPQSA